MIVHSSKTALRRRGRRGISIIETIVLMTAVAAMLGLCVLMLQMLMKLDGDSRARMAGTNALGRLAEQFRADVHAAKSGRVERPKLGQAGLRLESGPDRTVEYRSDGASALIRLESDHGKLVRRERYEIPRSNPITLSLEHEGDGELARLAVNRQLTRSQSDSPRVVEIMALLGRNQVHTVGGKP
jgi:hypothetical protein